jgi:hypothetical protein
MLNERRCYMLGMKKGILPKNLHETQEIRMGAWRIKPAAYLKFTCYFSS